MANESLNRAASPWNWVLVLIALAFVLAAWEAVASGKERISRLDLSRWGSDIDVMEALQISAYQARHFHPYIWGAMALDFVAFSLLCAAARRDRLRAFDVAVWMIWLLSAGWHGLNWLATV